MPPQAAELQSLRRRLLSWYAACRRDLPWRRERDPYRILVSEVMLQQTTVATVIPYYERFIARFPDLPSLVDAAEDEVLGLWSGLGYYSRARRLRQACAEILVRYGGRLPETYGELLDLPGVGPYTAGAVASIAFGREEPAMDGNVYRVLCRWAGLTDGREWRAPLEQTARRLVKGRTPGDLNQAIMELGALLCTPRNPACTRCPVASICKARRSGQPEAFPAPRRRQAREARRGGVLVIPTPHQGVCLVRRPAGQLMGGLLMFPGLSGYEAHSVEPTLSRVKEAAMAQIGCCLAVGAHITTIRHQVLNRAVSVDVWHGRGRRGLPASLRRKALVKGGWQTVEYRWGGHSSHPLTAACRKILLVMQEYRQGAGSSAGLS